MNGDMSAEVLWAEFIGSTTTSGYTAWQLYQQCLLDNETTLCAYNNECPCPSDGDNKCTPAYTCMNTETCPCVTQQACVDDGFPTDVCYESV